MGKVLIFVLVFVFLARPASSVDYIFHGPTYTLNEIYAEDNDDTTTVMISRSGTDAETSQQQTITLSTDCPSGVTATATEGDDFSVPSTITFEANVLNKAVPVTIETDEDDELREFFCLTIETDPGSEYTTIIVIPGNDFCYDINLAAESSYDIDDAEYFGPWLTDDSDFAEIWITPDGEGDIRIFLATNANIKDGDGFKWYGIYLDDSMGTSHGGTDGQSIIVLDADNGFEQTLATAELITAGTTHKFWLKYDQTSGTIELGTDDDRVNPAHQWQHGSSDALAIKHIFVSAAASAYIKLCQPGSPRKIEAVDASSSGSDGGAVARRAIDGSRDPVFSNGKCFLSDSSDNPWLRIDLGREYEVMTVLIWPVETTSPALSLYEGVNPTLIDAGQVYVGSCDANLQNVDVNDNIECSDDIEDFDAATPPTNVIETSCPPDTFGRYVYLLNPDDTPTWQFSVCEVEVYGVEIPYGDETEVEFTEPVFNVDDNNATVSISAIRRGEVLTCTSVDFYTSSSTVPEVGNTNDFTPISSLSPKTFYWDGNDNTGKEKVQSVIIQGDDLCEPYETFKVYLTNVLGGIFGRQSQATVGINDDDSVTYSLEADKFSRREGGVSVSIGILRSGTGTMQAGSAELTFTDGSATSADYDNEPHVVTFDVSNVADSEDGVIEIIDDQKYEEDETFTVTLGSLSPPDTCSTTGQYTSATVTIEDDDSQFRWNSDASLTVTEGESLTLEITREGDKQNKDLNILVNEGTAVLGDDFSIPSSSTSVTFYASDNDEDITVNTENDSDLENDETFTLTLEDPLYPTGNRGNPYRLTITIEDNDAEYSWKQASYSVGESGQSVTVCLERNGYTSSPKTVGISSVGVTAIRGADFGPLTSIEFAGGQREKCEQVEIFGDTAVDSAKTFTLTILPGEDIAVGEIATATVTIVDDDNIVGWSQPEYSFSEDETNAMIAISKSGVASISVTVTVTAGSATLNTDYQLGVSSGSSITIPTGSPSFYIPITLVNDLVDEPTESIILTLTSTSTGVISQATTTVYITDNDEPTPPPTDTGGIGTGAIAGIVAAAVVGVIVIASVIFIFWYMTNNSAASAPAAAQAAALPLANYPPGYAVPSPGYGYGNYPGGFGYERGLPNQAYRPYPYGLYR